MSINKKILITAAIGIAFGFSSCKKYLNVNTNPNVAQTATLKTLLPAAELYVGTSQGVDLEIDGSVFSEFWTQNPGASQYRALCSYVPGPDGFSTPWTNLYEAAENFFQLYKLADSQKAKQYMAISLLMRAYTFQLITDGWGDVPFKQALKGQYADSNIVNPKYDSQMVIYNGILAYIDSANKLINPNDVILPGSDDLVYGGDMTKWQKFGNTLALRIYMRMSAINLAAAQAGVDSLYANPVTNSFIGIGDDAFIGYGYNTANRNPLYAEEAGLNYVQNLVGSASCVDTMVNNNDPRVKIFYEPLPGTNVYTGLIQGVIDASYAGTASNVSYNVGGDASPNSASANAPVNLLTSYESLFLQAEVAARGWGGISGTDATLFQSAISANFNYYNSAFGKLSPATTGGAAFTAYMASGAYWTLYPAGGSLSQKLRYIITQKWLAMCGNQGFEAWTEWRRTGYPDFLVVSVSTGIGNNLPRRFTYPTSESTVNSNYPGLQPITSKVWWDLL